MKKAKEYPYVGLCPFCGQGLLRVWRHRTEAKSVVVCHECELVWNDVASATAKRRKKAEGNFQALVQIKTRGKPDWVKATQADLEELGLAEHVQGSCE